MARKGGSVIQGGGAEFRGEKGGEKGRDWVVLSLPKRTIGGDSIPKEEKRGGGKRG